MKSLLKEPLLHFILLGAVIFAVYEAISRRTGVEPRKILITPPEIERMAAGFAKTWQRPPTQEELMGLIKDRVREEIYCREAIALGLDRDDTVIRRRLRQKMEFISEDIAALKDPTDKELGAYLRDHPDEFQVESRFSFRQVYLNPSLHADHLSRDAADKLAQLNTSGNSVDLTSLGDPFLLEGEFRGLAFKDVARQFGEEFASRLAKLTVGRWEGPIESGYGAHLVRIDEKVEGRLPGLSEVREAVRRQWVNASRRESNESFYRELLKHYAVVVQFPNTTEFEKGKTGKP